MYHKKFLGNTFPETISGAYDGAAIGPIDGSLVILGGVFFHGGWIALSIYTLQLDEAYRRERQADMPHEQTRAARAMG